MKKRVKSVFSVVLAVCCILAGTMMNSMISFAADLGTMTNPYSFGTGGKYTHYWSTNNDHLDFYGTFKMNKQGYATICATKPVDDEGEVTSYEIYIYSSSGTKVWDCDTEGQAGGPTSTYKYNVGLKAGIYTVRYKADFYVESGNIDSTFSVKTTSNKYWEIEYNDSFSKATPIKLGKKYYAVYGENIESEEPDYFKIKLKKGKKYKVTLGNYGKLFSDTVIAYVYSPSKKRMFDCSGDLEDTGRSIIKAKKTGYYYLKLDNESRSGWKYAITVKKI